MMRALLPGTYRHALEFQVVTKKGAQPNLVLDRFLEVLRGNGDGEGV
jgi:hypothetical protein